MPQQIHSVGGDVVREQDKIQLVLAYLGILSLIPLLTVKDSEYVRYHAKQGLVLMGGFILVSIVLMFLVWIPFLGLILNCSYIVAALGITILAISKALKGERWQIPVVSDIAAKF